MNAHELEELVARCLQDFYDKRLKTLGGLRLNYFLRRKNPYLFRAVGIQNAHEIIVRMLADYLSASDETIFGDAFFEPVARIASGAKVSDGEGMDFTLETDNRIMGVALKSGPNPFNSSAKKRQSQELQSARNRLFKMQKQFDAVLGHAYGRRNTEPTPDRIYRDSSGQSFWTEITGDADFYLKMIRLMKELPSEHKKKYQATLDAAINRFTAEFVIGFCFEDGTIDWEKLVRFVSEKENRVVPTGGVS